jgi:hypothetical protein
MLFSLFNISSAVTMDWVVVDDPNNAADTNGTNSGSVSYEYSIGKYEVTVSQYCEFLNAVATTDSHGLYSGQMDIGRSGSTGSYTYSPDSGKDGHPIGYIIWLRALRFINWMHNDQPIIVDPNDPDPATEDGAYTLSGDNPNALRNPDAAYFLPNIDEWYKAAYYDPCTSSYWSYATGYQAAVPYDIGDTEVLEIMTTIPNRRAVPYTMSETGTIESITMYHESGIGGDMILAVYTDFGGEPNTLIGVTPFTPVSAVAGWQTIDITIPVEVLSGETIWLAWVYQNNPGIRFTAGTPGRASSDAGWEGGMPGLFGSSSPGDYIYSIYATYLVTSGVIPISEDPPGGTNSVNCDGSDTTAVGAYLDSISPYGTFDQNGNVEEWLEADISSAINKPVYGGRYNDSCPSSSDASVKLYSSTYHTNGFRVAASSEEPEDPDPVCLSYPASDLNTDCEVNLLDFAIMAGEWLICNWDQPEYCSQ